MGCEATNAGITIQTYNADGITEGESIHGDFAAMYGIARDQRLTVSEQGLDPVDLGSPEWLTVVAIADTDDKLQAMLRDQSIQEASLNHNPCESSASSRKVQLEIHIGERRDTLKDRVTISTGTVVPPSLDDPVTRLKVFDMKVFPPEIRLGDHPGLLGAWKDGSLLNQMVALGKIPSL